MSNSLHSGETPLHELGPNEAANYLESLRLIRKRSKIGAVVLASVVTLGSVLPADIAIGKASIENSKPVIHSIAEAAEEGFSEDPIVYIDGFARQDSSWQARNMVDALQEGTNSAVDALEYSEKGIIVDDIAREIAKKANGSSISLYGYSIGGNTALLVANALIHKYSTPVSSICLDHTPASIEDINVDQRNKADDVINVLDFFDDFGLELQYSSIARQLVNMNIPDNTTYIDKVSSSLLIDQYRLGTSVDTKEAIENLKSDKYPTPVVIYVSSSNPETDQVIKLVESERTFNQEANAANVPYTSLSVDGGLHGRPDLDESYQSILPEARLSINALINKAETLHRIQSGLDIHMRIRFH